MEIHKCFRCAIRTGRGWGPLLNNAPLHTWSSERCLVSSLVCVGCLKEAAKEVPDKVNGTVNARDDDHLLCTAMVHVNIIMIQFIRWNSVKKNFRN